MRGSRATWFVKLLMIPLLASCLPVNAEQPPTTRRYVRADAPPGGDGRSWRTAFGHLQDALACLDTSYEQRCPRPEEPAATSMSGR